MSFHAVCASLVLWLSLAAVFAHSPTELKEIIPRIPKCCPLGESLISTLGCKNSNLTFDPQFLILDNSTLSQKMDLIIGHHCEYGSYILDPSKNIDDKFLILPNGSLMLPLFDTNRLPEDYCLESFVGKDGATEVLPVLCAEQPPPARKAVLLAYSTCCLISVGFLIGTSLIHFLAGELQNMQGKALSCYSICLAAAYLCLTCVQLWGEKLEQRFCITIAFTMQFFFLACFFWLNIMCFHTCGKLTKMSVLKKIRSENQQFFCYSLYGWGLPLLLLGISLIMDLAPIIPSSYIKPNFGTSTCWFQNDIATLYYFYGPINVLLAINVVFFLCIITICQFSLKVKMNPIDDYAVQQVHQCRKKTFIQCFILFCVVGMNWVLEVLSWNIGELPQVWILFDILNSLQGVIVFFIFVPYNEKVKTWFYRKCKYFKGRGKLGEQNVPLNLIEVK